MQKFIAGLVVGGLMSAGVRRLMRGTRSTAVVHRIQGSLTSLGERLASKLQRLTGHTFKMEALMNHIAEKLGGLTR